jgi:hypothetical protein
LVRTVGPHVPGSYVPKSGNSIFLWNFHLLKNGSCVERCQNGAFWVHGHRFVHTPACRCAHYRRFAEQKRAKSAPTARFIELVRPAARRLPGLPVLLPQPSSAQETPAKSPKSPSCEAHFDRRPVRRRVFRRRVLRRRAQKVGKVKWAWSPIERRRLRTRESRKSKMVLEAYRERGAEDQ